MVGQPPFTCRRVETQVMAYLKGGLTRAETDAFRNHLLGCAACSNLVEEARQTDAELAAAAWREHVALPPSLSAAIQENVARKMRRALWQQRVLEVTGRLGAVAVSIALVLLLSALLAPGTGTGEPPATPQAPAEEPVVVTRAPLPTRPALATATTPSVSPTPRPTREVAVVVQTPEETARALIAAALQEDQVALKTLLDQPELSELRVWQRLSSCSDDTAASAFSYHSILYNGRFAGVAVSYGGELAGEIKLQLHDDGTWYLHYLNYASFSRLQVDCD